MRNKLWFLITALLIGALVLGACGRGGGDAEPTAVPAAEPTEAPAEEPTAVPTEVPATEEPAATEAVTETAEVTETEAMTETEAATDTAEVSETEATTGTAEAAASETTTDTAPVTGAENTLVIWADEQRASVLNDLADDFEEETGVTLAIVEKGFGQVRDDFKVAGPAGQGPDLMVGAHDWLGELAASGLLAEVSLGAKEDDFEPVAVDAFSYEGKLYGMPYAVENIAFYYNTDLVESCPATWDEVREISQQLIDDGMSYGFVREEGDAYHFFPIQTAFGGYVFGTNDDGSWNAEDVGIDSEGTVAAYEWLESMYADGLLKTGAALNGDLVLAAFQNGDAAMFISGPWRLDALRESGVPYAICNIPAGEAGPGAPFLGVQGFMVSAFSKQPLLAQTFLQEYVATTDTMFAFYEAGLRPSAFKPANELIEDEDLAAFGEAGVVGQPMPNIPQMSAVWSAWENGIIAISQGSATAEEAATEAAEQIRNLIAGN